MTRVSFSDVSSALRIRTPARLDLEAGRRAAVAFVLRQGRDGIEVLFIHRAEHPSDPWSGQMGLPGGRHEQRDADLLATAVRETHEEIGVDLSRESEMLGRLDEIRAIHRGGPVNLTITPFAFRLRSPDSALALSQEVQAVHWLSLDDLLGSRYRSSLDYQYEGETLTLPCFRVEGQVIWGLTDRMFSNLAALVREQLATADLPSLISWLAERGDLEAVRTTRHPIAR